MPVRLAQISRSPCSLPHTMSRIEFNYKLLVQRLFIFLLADSTEFEKSPDQQFFTICPVDLNLTENISLASIFAVLLFSNSYSFSSHGNFLE